MKREKTKTAILPEDVLGALLEATAPIAPEPERAKRMRERVLRAVASEKQVPVLDFTTIRNDEGEWVELTPLVTMKMLRGDADSRSFLVRMLPGAVLPAHDHPAEEECLMLEGEVWMGDLRLRAGDYHIAPKGKPHGEVRSKTGALFFIRGPNPAHSADAYR